MTCQPKAKSARRASDLTVEQVELIVKLYPDNTNSVLAAQFDLPIHSVKNLATRLGLRKTSEHMQSTAKQTQFKKGHTTWNKGKSHPAHPNTTKHHFKKGQTPHNHQPIGTTRISDGYLQVKTADTGNTVRDYQPVHHLVWIEKHGPIPADHCVIFKDKDRSNIELDNLECISRIELMRRNAIYNYQPELINSIRILAGFKRKLRRVSHDSNSQ